MDLSDSPRYQSSPLPGGNVDRRAQSLAVDGVWAFSGFSALGSRLWGFGMPGG